MKSCKYLSLKKRNEFTSLRSDCKTFKSKYFIYNFKEREKSKEFFDSKIGITISRKFGNAVRRNYMKRVIKDIIRNNLFPKNFDIEIIVKKIKKIEFLKLQVDLKYFKNEHLSK